MTDQAKSPRLTLSQIVEKLLARGGIEHSSVTLSRNAKGETQIEVVVRTDQPGHIETVEEAETKAAEVFDRLRGRFPLSSGYVGAMAPIDRDEAPAPPVEEIAGGVEGV